MIQSGQIIDGYQIVKFLGSGSFSQVWMATYEDGSHWALKVFNQSIQEDFRLMVEKEYDEIVNLKHPNIVIPKQYGYYKEGPYLIYPLCDGNISNLIANRISEKKKNRESIDHIFSENEIAKLLHDISNALIFLKVRKIIHQDIKPANILYKKDEQGNFSYFLSDFGTSFFINKTISKNDIYKNKDQDSYTTYGLSLGYASPEVYKNNPSYYSDVFSLGVSVYEMACGDLPSKSQNLGLGYTLLHENTVPELQGNYSDAFKSLIKSMMNRFPENRPEAGEIFKSAAFFLQNGIWQLEREIKTRGEAGFLTKNERNSSQAFIRAKSADTRKSLWVKNLLNNHKSKLLIALTIIFIGVIFYFLFIDRTADKVEKIMDEAKSTGRYTEAVKQLKQLSSEDQDVAEKTNQLLTVLKKYKIIEPFNGALAVVTKYENKKGVINSDFQEIIPVIYTTVNISHKIIFVQSESGLWGAYNSDGNTMLRIEYRKIEFNPDFTRLIATNTDQIQTIKIIN